LYMSDILTRKYPDFFRYPSTISNILSRNCRSSSLILAFVLTIFNSVAGMSLGFLASSLCDEEKYAMMLAIGAILPCFLVSGSIFPFEALPVYFQYVGYLVPGTLPGNALRAILLRGWGLEYVDVWLGFISSICWTIIYWTFTIIYHKLHT